MEPTEFSSPTTAADSALLPPPPPAPPVSPGRSSKGARRVIFAAVGVVTVVVAAGAVLAARPGPSSQAAALTTTTTISLKTYTRRVARDVDVTLCTGATSSACSVESNEGVLTIHLGAYVIDETKLRTVGKTYGFWDNADVARMVQTRALDGTQHSKNQLTTWTYHPDKGLNLTVDVERPASGEAPAGGNV